MKLQVRLTILAWMVLSAISMHYHWYSFTVLFGLFSVVSIGMVILEEVRESFKKL